MSKKDLSQFNREITVADLYPDLSPDERREAEYRLLRYLKLVKRIFERISRENPEFLTELERRAMLRKKRDTTDSF